MHWTLEEHLAEICPKCKGQHKKDWSAEFDRHKHYLILTCPDCGYELFLKTGHLCSGHHNEARLSERQNPASISITEKPSILNAVQKA